ncbi:MAG: NAD(+) synthase, partial [Coriobacteriaceae bacterium]|nr:NAD(+) synthase [Coriobacteriaceae bacterium]
MQTEKEYTRTAQAYETCVEAIKKFAQEKGFSDVVIGLSGGLDSALVAALCVDALGATQVHGVLLPGPYTLDSSQEDAAALAQNLSISTTIIPISAMCNSFEEAFAEAQQTLTPLARENVQARCRMICLMALSNTHGWMLMNTSNKSEALVGYCTLYGDMAGAFAPLGGLYKTEVYELARWRNSIEEAEEYASLIPLNILEKAPSAELSADQTDEASLGIAYSDLDRILIALVEEEVSVEEVCALGYAEEEVERVISLIKASAFKRRLLP